MNRLDCLNDDLITISFHPHFMYRVLAVYFVVFRFLYVAVMGDL